MAVAVDPLLAVELITTYTGEFKSALFDSQFYMYYMIGIAVFVLLLLILLWLELRSPRKRTARIKIKGGGTALLEVASVAQCLEYRNRRAGRRSRGASAHQQPWPRRRCAHRSGHQPLGQHSRVDVADSSIWHTDIIEGQLGVKIHGKVEINVKHEPYPRGTMPPTGPLGDKAVSPPPSPEPRAATPVAPTTPAVPPVSSAPVLIEPKPVVITPSLIEDDEENEPKADEGNSW